MATLLSYINSPEVKPLWRARYANTDYFVFWANQLLEELQERGFLRTTIKEVPALVKNGVWIDIPADYISLQKIFSPLDPNGEFRATLVNDHFKLMDVLFDDDADDDYETADTFSSSQVGSIVVNISDQAENALRGYLFWITAGAMADNGILLAGNDAVVCTSTKINYLFDLLTALDLNPCCATPDVTAAEFIPPEGYVMIRYNSIISEVSSTSDEMPIPDDCEARLVPTWLRWCCEREALSTSKDTIYWEGEKDRLLRDIQTSRAQRVNKAEGRRLIGLEHSGCIDKRNVDFKTLYDGAA